MHRLRYILSVVTLLAIPTHAAYAAPQNFKAFIDQLVELINLGTVALFSLAVVFFFWTVLMQLWGYEGDNAEQKKKIQETLFWGVIAIFVMVSIWGIISILQQTLSRGLV